MRRGRQKSCAFDGMTIQPLYHVRIVDGNTSHTFCSVTCAVQWLELQEPKLRELYVTDERNGRETPARTAFYVRSLVETNPVSGNRVHTFANRLDAENHARLCLGTMLTYGQLFHDGKNK